MTLPIIDLSQLDSPEKHADFYNELRHIAREIGFFYLTGHGISQTDMQNIAQQAKAFFALPLAEKQQIAMHHSPHFRGYTAVGEELTRQSPDYREQIDIGAELPVIQPIASDKPWQKLQGPNLWPDALPHFKPTVLEWQHQLRQVAVRLLRAFLVALNQPATALDDLIHDHPVHLIKLIHYPANQQQDASSQQGVGAHKDSGILTLLLQDDVGGLEVETDQGWIAVPPLKGAFVINIGEVLELATNGYLRANVHRVVRSVKGQDRYSIAYFLMPNLDAQVPLLPLDEALAAVALGPESDPNNPLLTHLGMNTLKGRLRSHPQVTQRFYPEHYVNLFADRSSTSL